MSKVSLLLLAAAIIASPSAAQYQPTGPIRLKQTHYNSELYQEVVGVTYYYCNNTVYDDGIVTNWSAEEYYTCP